jgi:hypothetical protein
LKILLHAQHHASRLCEGKMFFFNTAKWPATDANYGWTLINFS